MHGMMMNRPLRIAEIIGFAEKMHPNEQIISKTLQGEIHTSNYAVFCMVYDICQLFARKSWVYCMTNSTNPRNREI